MSKISDLRNNEKNKANFIAILETFVSDTKYIIMYQKLFKNMFQNTYSVVKIKETLGHIFPEIDREKLDSLNDLELMFAMYMFTNLMPLENNKNFMLFTEYNERKLIQRNDLQGYSSFDEVNKEVKIVKDKEEEKEIEKQVIKILDNDNWLIIKPLTYKSSLKYGATTKWCTASKDDAQYFKQYTTNGILIYILNKQTNTKFAIHKKLKEKATYWNAADKPSDLFDVNLDAEAYGAIREHLMIEKTNKTLYDEMMVAKTKPVKKEPTKPFAGHKNKSELLKQVQNQYENNERWAEYVKKRNEAHDMPAFIRPRGGSLY